MSLLSGAFLEQLTAAKDYDECIQLLMEKGWGEDGITNAGDILAIEKRKTWELINELVKDMSVFDVFLYANDYHNLRRPSRRSAWVMNTRASLWIMGLWM